MLADDHNEFAVALYRQLGRTPGNLLFSPFSIRAALAMAYAGARGETAAQMARVLGFPAAAGTPDTVVAAIMQRLGATAGQRHEFVVANSLWAQEGAPLRGDFLAFVGEHYGAEPELVDFVGRPADAAEAINAWVADTTQGRIAHLIREQPPPPARSW